MMNKTRWQGEDEEEKDKNGTGCLDANEKRKCSLIEVLWKLKAMIEE